MYASPFGCRGTGLSRESGLEARSASRGEECSTAEEDVGLGEGSSEWCLEAMIGMPDVCERKVEKEGAVMCARDECFFRAAWGLLGCEAEVGGSGKLSCWRWYESSDWASEA
jgi:hypothetical protein